MAYTFLDLACEVLKDAREPLSAREIWVTAVEQQLDKKLNHKSKDPAASMRGTLYGEYGIEKSRIFQASWKPKKFFLRSRQKEIETKLPDETGMDADFATEKSTYQEKDLHPLLSYFVYTNPEFFGGRQIRTKTIVHQKSKKKSLNEWLHPDMVGVYLPFNDLRKDVINLSKALNSNPILQLFSFELKKEINTGNYREYFFQAISNSSWAHEGYLVAAKISDDEKLQEELARLNNAFGIGVIHLNIEDVSSSRILYDAKNRDALDLDTINKLCGENSDFSSFIEWLNAEFIAGQVNLSGYDKIITNPDEHIRNKLQAKTAE